MRRREKEGKTPKRKRRLIAAQGRLGEISAGASTGRADPASTARELIKVIDTLKTVGGDEKGLGKKANDLQGQMLKVLVESKAAMDTAQQERIHQTTLLRIQSAFQQEQIKIDRQKGAMGGIQAFLGPRSCG